MRFDEPVPHDGYRWWYLDALSDDGEHGLTLIAFIGSVFSPYYAFARRRGPRDPREHCAVNVALYGRGGHRWAMTERGAFDLSQSADSLQIGPSLLSARPGALSIALDEVTSPLPTRLRGTLEVRWDTLLEHAYPLDAAARHLWQPLAPTARVEVSLDAPRLQWRGHAYLDSNRGERPLERDFSAWHWSRAPLGDGSAILYDVARRDGSSLSLGLRVGLDGGVAPFAPPPEVPLAASGWRIQRTTRSDPGATARVVATLEDGPFYARSLVDGTLLGQRVRSFHESLSLGRFQQPVVQAMLPFRMPRWRAHRATSRRG